MKFPVMAKVDVNGANAHPLWAWMKQETSSFGISGLDNIKWNFGKVRAREGHRPTRVRRRHAGADSTSTAPAPGSPSKFLLDKEGKVSKRFAPTSSPLSIAGDIEKLL